MLFSLWFRMRAKKTGHGGCVSDSLLFLGIILKDPPWPSVADYPAALPDRWALRDRLSIRAAGQGQLPCG